MSEPIEFPSGDTIPGSESNTGPEESHVESSPASSSSTEQEAAGFNEAWKPLLDQIPTEFHKLIQPELSKWDQNYQKLQEKYNPYKDFEGVTPQDLASAHTLLQQINDPEGARRIYEGLGEVLGISAKEAEKVVEATPAPPAVDPEDLTPEQREISELRKTISEIKEAQTAQQTIAQQQAQQALVKSHEENYTKSFEEIFTKDPSLKTDEIRRTDLHNRAMAYIQDPNFKGDEVQQAWIDQRKYNDYLAGVLSSRQDPNSNAPLHISPSGGNPGSGVDPSKRTEQERIEAFAQRLAAAQNQ
jgi:hypothetical protein